MPKSAGVELKVRRAPKLFTGFALYGEVWNQYGPWVYLYFYVKSWGIAQHEVGAYVGFITAALYLGRALAGPFWHGLWSQLGPRIAVLFMLTVSIVLSLGFGFCVEPWTAGCLRLLSGMFMGTRVMIEEGLGPYTLPAGGQRIPIVAYIACPIIAGGLAQSRAIRAYPFLMPSLAHAIFTFCALLIAIRDFLMESTPSKLVWINPRDGHIEFNLTARGSPIDNALLGNPSLVDLAIRSPTSMTQTRDNTQPLILTFDTHETEERQQKNCVYFDMVLALHIVDGARCELMDTFLVVLLYTSPNSRGCGFTPLHTAVIIATSGIFSLILVYPINHFLHQKFGFWRTIQTATALGVICALLCTTLSWTLNLYLPVLPRQAITWLWALILFALKDLTEGMVWTSFVIFLSKKKLPLSETQLSNARFMLNASTGRNVAGSGGSIRPQLSFHRDPDEESECAEVQQQGDTGDAYFMISLGCKCLACVMGASLWLAVIAYYASLPWTALGSTPMLLSAIIGLMCIIASFGVQTSTENA